MIFEILGGARDYFAYYERTPKRIQPCLSYRKELFFSSLKKNGANFDSPSLVLFVYTTHQKQESCVASS